MNILGKLISPKMGINLMRSQISKTIKKDVTDFDMIFSPNKNSCKIVVEKKFYTWENDTLPKIIEEKAKENLKENQKLDFVKLEIKGEIVTARVYLTENTEKKCLIYTL